MALHTSFTKLVGCDVPIQLAPMGGVPTPALIAAVVEAGGMGGFGTGPMPVEALAATLDQIRAHTDGPLAVNILMPFLDRDAVKVAADAATVVDFYHGAPDGVLVNLVHEYGSLAGWQVGCLDDALAAEEAGCDLLIVRGVEGGGRMHGNESLWPLLADVVEAVSVPALAAGGIGDSRGLAAALAAGAAGVRMGTRFLAAAESGVHDLYRDALIRASAADTILTDEFRADWPDEESSSRVLRASLDAARSSQREIVGELSLGPMTVPVQRFSVAPPLAGSSGSVEAMAMYAGESVRFVRGIEPAGAIVTQIAEGAEELLRAWH